MKPDHITRHHAAQDEGQFSPYYVAPVKPHIQPILIPCRRKQHRTSLALAVSQVLACAILGAAFVAGVVLLRYFTR